MNQHTTIQQLEGLLAYHDAGHDPDEADLIIGSPEPIQGVPMNAVILADLVDLFRAIACVCRTRNVSLTALAKMAVDRSEQDRLRSAPTQTPSPPAAP